MKNNDKPSPVVYWTSEWIETGEVEIRSYNNNTKKEVKKRILRGKLNTEYRKIRLT